MEILKVMLHPVLSDAYKFTWENNVNFSCALLVEQEGNLVMAFLSVGRELPVPQKAGLDSY